MGKLSRPQFQVLLAAAASDEGAIPLSENLNSGNAAMTIGALIRLRLISVVSRPDGTRWVVITDLGRGRVRNGASLRKRESVNRAVRKVTGGSFGRFGPVPACSKEYAAKARRPRGKMGLMTTLLEREEGACVAELAEATGWKQSSVHGVLSSRFGPRWGKPLLRKKTPEGTRYWLIVRASEGG